MGKFFARNLGGLIHARTRVPGRLGKATSRTPSMYVDEKSDEAILLEKRLNKGRQLSAEVVEGRASLLAGRGSDTEPKCRVDPNDGCAAGVTKAFIARRRTLGRSPVR